MQYKLGLSKKSIAAVVTAWVVIGVVHASARYADIVRYKLNVPFSLTEVLYFVASYSLWIVVTTALLACLTRVKHIGLNKSTIGLFLGVLVIWLPVYFSTDYAIGTLREGGGFELWLSKLNGTSGSVIFFYVVVYALTFAACLGVVFSTRTKLATEQNESLQKQQMNDALKLAEKNMELMQSQLSPHFLFNSLSAISGLAREQDRDALISAVAKVGQLLRFTVENAKVSRITLDEELQFVRDYVALQQLRFGDRFSFQLSSQVQDTVLFCPPFTLQPLIENCFRHAVENTEDFVGIEVTIQNVGNTLSFRVCNTHSNKTVSGVTLGTGMKNLETRLEYLYPQKFNINVSSSEEKYCVHLTLELGGERV